MEQLEASLHGAREAAENTLVGALDGTSISLLGMLENGAFPWGIAQNGHANGRSIFRYGQSAEVYFADKHLQRVIRAATESRSVSRHQSTSGLLRTLDNRLPKTVVRFDVSAFYESVDHDVLRAQLGRTAMNATPRRLIDGFLDESAALLGVPVGLPAGIGMSAALGDLLLSVVDTRFRSLPNILYYARYVDDVVMVLADGIRGSLSDDAIRDMIASELGAIRLRSHPKKEAILHPSRGAGATQFNFLGYEISMKDKLSVDITHERGQRLRKRIDRTFAAWSNANSSNHGKRRLLLDRCRMLTGNVRLTNNKRNAMAGVYFTNPLITSLKKYRGLDNYLAHKVSQASLPAELMKVLESLSFVDGFQHRTVYVFEPRHLSRIKGVWNG
ncbi:RNA-directed DNA polymerase [Cellulosimicrobium marinum]|nr:RNA-directed DNA polymerase [Cellulosimicrobium marinum]